MAQMTGSTASSTTWHDEISAPITVTTTKDPILRSLRQLETHIGTACDQLATYRGSRKDHKALSRAIDSVDAAFKDFALTNVTLVWPQRKSDSVKDGSVTVASASKDKGKGKATDSSQSKDTDPGPLIPLIIALTHARKTCDKAIEEVAKCQELPFDTNVMSAMDSLTAERTAVQGAYAALQAIEFDYDAGLSREVHFRKPGPLSRLWNKSLFD